MYLLAAGWRRDERHRSDWEFGINWKHLCDDAKYLPSPSCSERKAQPVEATSLLLLFFLLVFVFSSLLNSVSGWECVVICFSLHTCLFCCLQAKPLICRQYVWEAFERSIPPDLQIELQWTNQGKIWERAKRESRSSVRVFLCLWWHILLRSHTDTFTCVYLFFLNVLP